jgi:tetratricopeptide (TPR) repeat protein
MKRCPECRRDYYDDSLLYCLDDGTALLEGPSSGSDANTAIMPGPGQKRPAKRSWVFPVTGILALAVAISAAWWLLGSRSPDPQSGSAPSRPANENYVRARVLIRNENKEDIDAAVKLLEQVVAEEPDFAAGWAALARGYNAQAFYFAGKDDRKQLTVNAEVAVERALRIDPDLGEAHFARGMILWTHAKRFPHEQAIQSCKRALELDPKMDEAHHQLGLIYLHLGLFDKAQAHINKALEINPSNTLARFRSGFISLYQARYEDAYQIFKSTPLEKTPAFHAFQTATALFRMGRLDEAEAMIDKFLSEYPNDEGGVGTSVRAMILAKKGRAAEAERAIERADEVGREFGHFHHAAYNIGTAYSMLGRSDDAIKYLQLAADDGFPCYPVFATDEQLEGIRKDSQFVSLIANMKQQWDKYNATL